MKVNYLHQYFNTPAMAGGTRSYEMARRLVAKGHEVNLITSWREATDQSSWFETEESGVRVHWLPVPYSNRMGFRERIRAFQRFAWNAAAKAASLESDVVFATSTPLTIAVPGAFASWRRRVPMVFEVRDLWPELPIAIGALENPLVQHAARRLERFAYARSESIVALSPGMREGIEKAGVSPDRISMIPNSSDLDVFSPDEERGRAFRERHGIPQDRLLVTYGGTFGRINGVEYLVRVAHELVGDDRVYFLLVGDGQEREKADSLSRELGVQGVNLRMLPKVSKAEMADVLAATDVATSLFIPLKEMEANSANKFFDGLAAGCCMAVNYGGWHPELLESSGAGVQLGADPADGAEKVAALADNPEWVRRAGVEARRLAEERFSRDVLADQLEQVLLRAAGEPA
ncbi:glycosyltransferase family 4 protein [Aquisalimonas sp. APHAB1-3]|uniref:glycosyltransferase family 4 protein n=1 Tax=Aquisalimonas sp. APHAB1-3 TaxID=3402080 RepID=UPI003AAC11A6